MAQEQAIINTIKKMLSSQIEEETIVSSLKEIGLSENEAQELIDKAKGSSSSKAMQTQQETDEEEAMLEPVEEEIAQARSKLAARGQEESLKNSQLHSRLEEHSEKMDSHAESLDDLHSKINALNKKLSSIDIQS